MPFRDRSLEASVLACMVQVRMRKEDYYAASQASRFQISLVKLLRQRMSSARSSSSWGIAVKRRRAC